MVSIRRKTQESLEAATNPCLFYVMLDEKYNWNVCLNGSSGISVFSLSLEVVRLSILLSYNYCNGYPPTTYIEYPLLLAQQSTLLYLALKFKNLLYTETVLFSMLLYLTIALFMTDTLPTIALNYIIVSIILKSRGLIRKQSSLNRSFFHYTLLQYM